MLQLLGNGVEAEQKKRHIHEMAIELGRILEQASDNEYAILVKAINKVMTNTSKDNLEYASGVISELKILYPEIDSKYSFELEK